MMYCRTSESSIFHCFTWKRYANAEVEKVLRKRLRRYENYTKVTLIKLRYEKETFYSR